MVLHGMWKKKIQCNALMPKKIRIIVRDILMIKP